ncbi:polyprenyl synthetase family protein [candidate division KSB1 bacterium]
MLNEIKKLNADNFEPNVYFEILADQLNNDLEDVVTLEFPPNLYNPMKYALGSKGKRFRPIILILACESINGKVHQAYNASIAIEILHNFTLVHDDIMDNDDLRRGRPTVHKKWNKNTAILAGDGLIALAYRYLLRSKSRRLKNITKIFSEAIIRICEGQSLDKDLETVEMVSIDEYLDMISRKTAILISVSAELGGILGGGDEKTVETLHSFGFELGMAFQIQDDLLDLTSNESELGKDSGSDIKEGKMTYPLIKLIEFAKSKDRNYVKDLIKNKNASDYDIINVQELLEKYGVVNHTKSIINKHINKANTCLKGSSAILKTDHLLYLSEKIRDRKY